MITCMHNSHLAANDPTTRRCLHPVRLAKHKNTTKHEFLTHSQARNSKNLPTTLLRTAAQLRNQARAPLLPPTNPAGLARPQHACLTAAMRIAQLYKQCLDHVCYNHCDSTWPWAPAVTRFVPSTQSCHSTHCDHNHPDCRQPRIWTIRKHNLQQV